METLDCSNNQLTALDVANCANLTSLTCSDNEIEQLDLSKHQNLLGVDCQNNQLTTLDVSHNTALTYLDCSGQKNETGKSQNLTLKLTQLQYDKHKSDNGNDWFAPEDVVVDSKV